MASELNQEIVKASAEGLAPNGIYDRVNRAVSESYIHSALRNRVLTLRTTAKWAMLKWMPLFIVLSVPFAFAGWLFARWSSARWVGQAERSAPAADRKHPHQNR